MIEKEPTAYELGLGKRAEDLTGRTFGQLKVIRFSGKTECRASLWACLCQCGDEVIVIGSFLKNGVTSSCKRCGLSRRMKSVVKHRMTESKEYKAWSELRARTTNPNNRGYKNYGGRGIKVCDRWNDSFNAFFEDVGPAPSPDHSIDRINNNGNYEPGNCRWADAKTQARNTRRAIILTHEGKTMTATEWAEATGIPYGALRIRIKVLNWDTAKALTTPIRKSRRKK